MPGKNPDSAMTVTYGEATWTVRDYNVGAMHDVIKRLPARLAAGATLHVGKVYFLKRDNGDKLAVVDVTYTGPVSAKHDGWRIVAVTEWTTGGPVTMVAPDATCAVVRPAAPVCDHCGTKRGRNWTWTAVNDAGEHLYLGGDCAEKYWGGIGIWAAFNVYNALKDLAYGPDDADGDDGWGGGGRANCWDLDDVLGMTIELVAEKGYEKGGVTKAIIATALGKKVGHGVPAAKIEALKALVMGKAGDSEYWLTVKEIIKAGHVTRRTLGWVVSVPTAAARLAVEEVVSEWVGVEGARAPMTLTLLGRYENNWGLTSKLVDDKGNAVVCFGVLPPKWAVGETKAVVAYAKKHDLYNGKKSTVINRLKAV